MENGYNLYFILIGVGVATIAVVVILYFIQKGTLTREPRLNVGVSSDDDSHDRIQPTGSSLDIRGLLAVHRSDQPLFLQHAENLLTRLKSKSEIKVLQQVVKEYEVAGDFADAKTNLLKKMEQTRHAEHSFMNQPKRLGRKDEIDDLTHERDVASLKQETSNLINPPQQVAPAASPSTSDIEKARKEGFDRQLEEARALMEQDVRFKQLREEILGGFDQKMAQKRMRQMDRLRDDYSKRKIDIMKNQLLSVLEKEAQLRALQKEFIIQLDRFESSL